MKGIYNLFEFLKSEFAVCSANNFLSFNACGITYLVLGVVIFCVIASYYRWDK